MGAGQRAAVALLLAATVFPGGAASAANHVVEVRDNFYEPVTVTVPAGSTVVWEQTEFQPHTVTATDGSWDSHPDCGSNYEECMLYGDRYERSFPEPGTYEYFCRIHGTSMSGTVIVTEAEPSPTASPTTSPSPSPLPTVTASPTVTVPAPTASPSPSPTAPQTSEPSLPPSPSVAESSSATPSVGPSSPSPSASASPSASHRPSAGESDLPLGTPAADEGSPGGMSGLLIALVALVAVGLGTFGYRQLRTAQREAGP